MARRPELNLCLYHPPHPPPEPVLHTSIYPEPSLQEQPQTCGEVGTASNPRRLQFRGCRKGEADTNTQVNCAR